MTLGDHLHEEDLQQDFSKLFAHTHPGAPAERDVLESGGVSGRFGHEALRLEVLLVGEALRHIVGVTDAVDNVPAFGNLETLKG